MKNSTILKRAAIFSAALCLFGCGYRWTESGPLRTLTVPYVAGDEDGMLTGELIRAFASETHTQVVSSGGQYRLEAAFAEQQNETIGYRLDPQKNKGKIEKNIVASEGRKTLCLDISLFEGDQQLFGPHRVFAYADYDYVDGDSLPDLQFTDSTGQKRTVLAFSLGQLESVEAAQETATRPLYKKISQKVVDVISSQW